jgi:DNA-binding transcriptional LysR family regulator
MHVEHTTIGRRLTALERALGAPLLLRGPDGLRLTALGEQVSPLVSEVERAVSAVQAFVASHTARVRLAVPSGFTPMFAGALAQLGRERAGLAVELVSGARRADLQRSEADVAVRIGPVTDPELVTKKLADVGSSLYASESYLREHPQPLQLEDLTGHVLIGYDQALASTPAAAWIEQQAPRAPVVLRSRELVDMTSAAMSGVGIALLPCMLGDVVPQLRRLTPDVICSRTLCVAYRRESALSDNVRAVVQLVSQVVTANAALISGARAS